jgi:antitoxin (DNA-binding transcriptional repressor) of toxin-antitoxin stability system
VITVNTHEAKTRLSALLAAVEQHGEIITICRNGKPVAELRLPATPSSPKRSRLEPDPLLKGRILFDPTESASDEEWPEDAR